MAALSAAAARLTRNVGGKAFHDYVVATNAVIYAGSLVNVVVGTGRVAAATSAAGRKFVGLSTENATGNTAGTVTCRVEWGMEALIDCQTALSGASTYIGSNVAIDDDNMVTTMSNVGTAAVRVRCGELISFNAAETSAWVRLRCYSESDS
jgi:hypothetical protein